MPALRSAAGRLEPLAERMLGTRAAIAAARHWRRGGCVVLCYHMVRDPTSFDHPNMVTRPETFREHVALLARHTEVVGIDGLNAPSSDSRPRIAVTFDDGYRELLDHALPALAEHGMPCVVHCCSEVVAGRQALWWDLFEAALRAAPPGPLELESGGGRRIVFQLSDQTTRGAARLALWEQCASAADPDAEAEHVLSQLPLATVAEGTYMAVDDLRRARELGAEIGSHGRTHVRLTTLGDRELADELAGSKADLEQTVGAEVRSIAYPYGDVTAVDPRVIRATAAVGYRASFTIRPALVRAGGKPFAVPRVPVHLRDTGVRFRAKALGPHPGIYDWVWRRTAG